MISSKMATMAHTCGAGSELGWQLEAFLAVRNEHTAGILGGDHPDAI